MTLPARPSSIVSAKNDHRWLLIVLLIVCGYVIYRAQQLSFTHDESLSYTIVRDSSGWRYTANHHPLNTAATGLSRRVFGDSQLALRLPNVLAFLVYAASGYAWLAAVPGRAARGVGAVLLFLNPFLLEHFSIARGYGLCVAFVTASLLFLLSDAAPADPHRFWRTRGLALLFAVTALAANYTALNYVLGVVALLGFDVARALSRAKRHRRTHLTCATGAAAVTSVAILAAVRSLTDLQSAQQLYFGSDSLCLGLRSLFPTALPSNVLTDLTWPVLAGTAILTGIGCCWRRPLCSLSDTSVRCGVLLVILLLAIVAQRWLLAVPYPSERTALYLYPVITALVTQLLADAGRSPAAVLRRVSRGTALVAICALGADFVGAANLSYVTAWRYDAATKAVVETHLEIVARRSCRQPLHISNHWLFEPTLNYYIRSRGLPIAPADRHGFDPHSDFFYTLSDDDAPAGFRPVAHFPVSDTILYERVSPTGLDTNRVSVDD